MTVSELKKKTLRQVSFEGMGVFIGIAYEPFGHRHWSVEYYSLDDGKYTKLDRGKIKIADNTGVYYRKVLKRINNPDIREWNP